MSMHPDIRLRDDVVHFTYHVQHSQRGRDGQFGVFEQGPGYFVEVSTHNSEAEAFASMPEDKHVEMARAETRAPPCEWCGN